MKITTEQLRQMVDEAITEAKKAKKKGLEEKEVRTDGHVLDQNMDFSAPLGGFNVYKNQGASNIGPYTGGGGPSFEDRPLGESALRQVVRGMVEESFQPDPVSVWSAFAPPAKPTAPQNVWESAMHYYDFQRRGLGQVKEDASPPNMAVDEKHLGFKKLKGKLSHEKGVKDPGALAASIGRAKYGKKGMAKKAAAGKK